ncbi:MAG: hypothetical protein JXP34_23920 [Planctomycetes bacterium]|nr:hypothetical protein [Planctomycetota bacterium]
MKMISAFLLVALLLSPCAGQTYSLAIPDVEALPGREALPVPVQGTFPAEVHGYQVSVVYDTNGLDLVELTLRGTALEGQPIESFLYWWDPAVGKAWAQVLVDTVAPLEGLPPATDQPLLALVFDVETMLLPGESYGITFRDGVGNPPRENLYYDGDQEIVPTTTDGSVTITNDNFLVAQDQTIIAGEKDVVLPFVAINTHPLMGFSMVARFDPAVLTMTDMHVQDTITEAVGAEFVDPIIRNDEGYFILGVLLDVTPPFEDQRIPATGLDLVIAKGVVDVREDTLADETEIVFTDELGDPPISNVFVIDSQSIRPRTVDGVLTVLHELLFVRGDANGDGRVNIADPVAIVYRVFRGTPLWCEDAGDTDDNGRLLVNDPVYLLQYLFLQGPLPPAPFPTEGRDPTADSLDCWSKP